MISLETVFLVLSDPLSNKINQNTAIQVIIPLNFMKYIPLQYALRTADMPVQTNSNDSEDDIDYTNPVSSQTPAA